MPRPLFFRVAALLVVLATAVSLGDARTLRLFHVGNSFSNNATRLLPELAKNGGHELIIGRAVTGGCSLERHWNAVEAFLADPNDPKGKIYSGKSLWDNIRVDTWDVITVQQNSMNSTDYGTYQPYAAKLHAHLQKLQPKAEIVIHQTWAYRTDAAVFGQIGGGKNAATQKEMWERSRAAYWQLAQDLRARVIPVGDAFWRVDSDPQWGYRVDPRFDAKTAEHPALPLQRNSLHVGYRWSAQKKLGKDANHANVAGEYLGALVWYGFLFAESPEKLTYVPPGVAPEFARHLRSVAWQVVQETAAASRKVAAPLPAAAR
ncbi:MAG: DUF4886 domain-containing protein [Opitutaceae bacterium]|nr:DUF4886 domain-containing protein [Opitutaceae bacterium]